MVRWWYSVDEWVPLLGVVAAQPARLPQYVSLFVLGTMAYRGDWLRRLGSGVGRTWLGVGLVASLCMVTVQMLAPESWRYNELANGGLGWVAAPDRRAGARRQRFAVHPRIQASGVPSIR